MIRKAEDELGERFAEIDANEEKRTREVLDAFRTEGVSYRHFSGTTGYGYDDIGRDTLERVYARVFHTEAGLMRPHIASGTAALSLTLFGMTRPGEEIVSATGIPYDTLLGVIGIGKKPLPGSLKEMGVTFECVELKDGRIDVPAVEKAITDHTRLVIAQRSRGYAWRPSLFPADFEELADMIHTRHPGVTLMVDNCYGEFVQKTEPTQHGADLIAGSLIKNAGGSIARTGGYIAGRKDLVELCSYRATVPGLGKEVGCTLGESRNMYMGLFNAPNVVTSALKTAVFAASLFEELGFEVTPGSGEERYDIIQAIKLINSERLCAFCKGIQSGAPVDSSAVPEPWDMPGYDSKVIMAAGAFILGSSIELSADAPLREPYAVWMQGGINFPSGKTAVMLAADYLCREGLA
jgi:cystathionine beta-lyase family protein involved in aluminum resistance